MTSMSTPGRYLRRRASWGGSFSSSSGSRRTCGRSCSMWDTSARGSRVLRVSICRITAPESRLSTSGTFLHNTAASAGLHNSREQSGSSACARSIGPSMLAGKALESSRNLNSPRVAFTASVFPGSSACPFSAQKPRITVADRQSLWPGGGGYTMRPAMDPADLCMRLFERVAIMPLYSPPSVEARPCWSALRLPKAEPLTPLRNPAMKPEPSLCSCSRIFSMSPPCSRGSLGVRCEPAAALQRRLLGRAAPLSWPNPCNKGILRCTGATTCPGRAHETSDLTVGFNCCLCIISN
mmetsp:Transcript_34421/g.97533  ORF Transcript_34421/g.97533 Transcript_34421/m.97533 type:complete len:295 (-) Transcript_34421:20-904(-)